MKPKWTTKILSTVTGLTLVLVMLATWFVVPAFADTSGPNSPGAGADVADVGTEAWSNPGNITSAGSPYASVTIGSGEITHYLQGTQYGFAIPPGSAIRGISVVINRQTSGVQAPFIRDSAVHLLKNGLVTGENKALTGTDWPTTFGGRVYGGENDLWGTTWSAAEINSANFGVALSATNAGNSTKTATVDFMQIMVFFSPGSTTTVDCGSGNPVTSVGTSITCVAIVTRASGTNTPSGPVFWTTNGSGTFATSPCLLLGSGGVSTCSVNYTPSALGSGAHLISATYPGDFNFSGSNDNQFVTVSRGTPTLSVTNSPVTYTGSPQAAVVTGSVVGTVSNVLYDGTATAPTDAGTYAVTADFVPNDTVNYESLTGAAAGNLVINKAAPTLSVTNSPATFTGLPQAADVSGSVPGTVSNVRYDGSATIPTGAGTYAVTANFVPNDTANYESLTGAAAGDFVINKAAPTLSVTNSPVTYTGSPHAADVSGSVPGTVSDVLYDGTATAPTDAGTYAVTADFVPNDTANYESLTDASAGDFVIHKATPTLSVTNSPVTYTGLPQAADVAGSVPGTVSDVLYDGTTAAPTDVGTYAVTADFVPNDTVNYESLAGAAAGDFVIHKATPTLSVTNSPVIYNGSPQAADVAGSVPGTVSDVLYDGSATAPTDVGTYAVTADFVPNDTVNYESLTGAEAGNFVINPAGPGLTLVKTPTPTTFSMAGDVIVYTYQLTNTGNVALEGPFTVVDDKVTVTCPVTTSLAPTESILCNASYTITLQDLLVGSVTNSATGYASHLGDGVASVSVEATVTSTATTLFLPITFRE